MKTKTKLLNFLRALLWKFPPWRWAAPTLNKFLFKDNLVLKFVPNHYQFPKGTIRKCVRRRLHWNLDLSDLLGWAMYFNYKDAGHRLLFSLVKSGDFAIDVGANHGGTCLSLALRVGNEGLVFAFEPFPRNFHKLAEHAKLNPMPQLKIFSLGIGNRNSELKMEGPDQFNSGTTRIAINQDTIATAVPIRRLDDLLAEQAPGRRVDLMKIDTEGYELEVLKGAEQTLKRFGPKLFIEVEDLQLRRQGTSAQELLSYLQALGYQFLNANNNRPIDMQRLENCIFDIVARK